MSMVYSIKVIGILSLLFISEGTAMAKTIDMPAHEVSALLRYEPETGKFFWRVTPSRRQKAGDEAGSIKAVRSRDGAALHYRYINMKGISTPATRVAWLLQKGEWPTTNIQFKDGDPANLRWENLEAGRFPTIKETSGGLKRYRMSKEAARHYGLKRYYGLTGEQYGQMLADQKGLCAICNKPETAVFNGQPKVMHVDHCHETGQIRALLCGKCNGMLGLACDSPANLRAAADYIERHATQAANVVPMKKEAT